MNDKWFVMLCCRATWKASRASSVAQIRRKTARQRPSLIHTRDWEGMRAGTRRTHVCISRRCMHGSIQKHAHARMHTQARTHAYMHESMHARTCKRHATNLGIHKSCMCTYEGIHARLPRIGKHAHARARARLGRPPAHMGVRMHRRTTCAQQNHAQVSKWIPNGSPRHPCSWLNLA